MPDSATLSAASVASTSLPITIEDQGEGFHAVIAGALGLIFVTNDVGKFVISLCDGRRTFEQIVSAVGECYAGVSPERVRKDVTRFLAAATNMGLVGWTG